MDRNHSRLIIILLAGILCVMLVGRDAAIGFLGNAFWVALVVGTLVLIVLAIIGLIRFTRREARLYREEVGRDRQRCAGYPG